MTLACLALYLNPGVIWYGDNNIYFTKVLWGMKEIMKVKCPAEWPTHERWSGASPSLLPHLYGFRTVHCKHHPPTLARKCMFHLWFPHNVSCRHHDAHVEAKHCRGALCICISAMSSLTWSTCQPAHPSCESGEGRQKLNFIFTKRREPQIVN